MQNSAPEETLVSVYLPTKNRSALVQRAANSVLTQSYRDIELLIVDDGSTDDTPRILDELAADDPRVRVLRNEKSMGAPFSRNLAITASRGAWITGIDDDDMFLPGRIEAFVDYWRILESSGAQFSCIYAQDLYDSGTGTSQSYKRGTMHWEEMFEYNVVGNQIFSLTTRIKGAGMFDVQMPAWQDLDLFIRVLKQYGPARLLDAPLYLVSIDDRPDRISKSKKEKILVAFERLLNKHPEIENTRRQTLFLQIFGKLYGYNASFKDVLRFLSFGWNFRNAKRLLGVVLGRS